MPLLYTHTKHTHYSLSHTHVCAVTHLAHRILTTKQTRLNLRINTFYSTHSCLCVTHTCLRLTTSLCFIRIHTYRQTHPHTHTHPRPPMHVGHGEGLSVQMTWDDPARCADHLHNIHTNTHTHTQHTHKNTQTQRNVRKVRKSSKYLVCEYEYCGCRHANSHLPRRFPKPDTYLLCVNINIVDLLCVNMNLVDADMQIHTHQDDFKTRQCFMT